MDQWGSIFLGKPKSSQVSLALAWSLSARPWVAGRSFANDRRFDIDKGWLTMTDIYVIHVICIQTVFICVVSTSNVRGSFFKTQHENTLHEVNTLTSNMHSSPFQSFPVCMLYEWHLICLWEAATNPEPTQGSRGTNSMARWASSDSGPRRLIQTFSSGGAVCRSNQSQSIWIGWNWSNVSQNVPNKCSKKGVGEHISHPGTDCTSKLRNTPNEILLPGDSTQPGLQPATFSSELKCAKATPNITEPGNWLKKHSHARPSPKLPAISKPASIELQIDCMMTDISSC